MIISKGCGGNSITQLRPMISPYCGIDIVERHYQHRQPRQIPPDSKLGHGRFLRQSRKNGADRRGETCLCSGIFLSYVIVAALAVVPALAQTIPSGGLFGGTTETASVSDFSGPLREEHGADCT